MSKGCREVAPNFDFDVTSKKLTGKQSKTSQCSFDHGSKIDVESLLRDNYDHLAKLFSRHAPLMSRNFQLRPFHQIIRPNRTLRKIHNLSTSKYEQEWKALNVRQIRRYVCEKYACLLGMAEKYTMKCHFLGWAEWSFLQDNCAWSCFNWLLKQFGLLFALRVRWFAYSSVILRQIGA